MKITAITIDEFTVFKHLELEFSRGLNVFIGANATGKSHLMKLLYSYLKTSEHRLRRKDFSANDFEAKLAKKLAAVFKPDDDQTGRLVRRPAQQSEARVQLSFSSRQVSSFHIDASGAVHIPDSGLWPNSLTRSSIFIPSREALAMFEEFTAAYQHRELSFDETYYDLCVALSATRLRGKLQAPLMRLARSLESILGGRVKFTGNRFYIESCEGMVEAHLLAEGLRKIGSLAHLINNGSLMKNSVLFWDEPEANLNPVLVTKIAQVLRELVKAGVQVFVATHDYLLSHELSLAVEYQTKPAIDMRFFAFSQESETDPVTVEWGDTLADLEHNPILEEFARHYERERDLFANDMSSDGADTP